MGRGEMFSLKWSDVDFEAGLITIRAFNTKTMRQRQVAMTDRLRSELLRLSGHQEENLVFGIKTSAKSAFNNAKKRAGLPDLRFHDLRHTHATRLVGGQMPLPEVGRVLGHTQQVTTVLLIGRKSSCTGRPPTHLWPVARVGSCSTHDACVFMPL